MGGHRLAPSAYLSDVQYAPISSVDGSIGVWTTTTSFLTGRQGLTSAIYNGYVYVLGGFDGTTYYNDVQYAQINANGTVGAWTTTTSFVSARYNHTTVSYNGYVYVLGGINGSTYYNTVQYAKIDSPGLTQPYTAPASSPAARAWGSSAAYNGYLYFVGGCSAVSADTCTTFTQTVSYAPINTDGTLGTWAIGAGTLPQARAMGSLIAYEGRLYYISGRATTTTLASNLTGIYYATLNASTGLPSTWSANSADNAAAPTGLVARYGQASMVYNGYLYVIGGCTTAANTACAAFLNTVQYAKISSAGIAATHPVGCGNSFCTTTAFHHCSPRTCNCSFWQYAIHKWWVARRI